MTPRRKKRLTVVLLILCGAAATVGFTTVAFRQNFLFFYTPTQIKTGDADVSRVFRLGGLVAIDSIKRQSGQLETRFIITDNANKVTVSYSGILPDLFREGQGVVARGQWKNKILIADEVLAKHDENYTPLEVQDALKASETLIQ